ncbi:hypothetical protein HMPREF0578_0058 [Mobiluncus mulieris 28-1]|uniref:Lipoprotein n=1 Tax=Mobiluncus mulieris TaxID=2052 RepID=A0A378PEQ8_9ACTO|nr:hypothetical protein [Mobiluncus mulieris]EEZ90154.1 hypothetical protein HMPREF0578_0058 [Mobiluncus mulieris 28-1]MBB5846342.1 hypothetical protein [Mobiluncus mulieris]MCV0012127.1 hypothetical protein [Mobiluncus mulieris]NMW60696.1 hypothetical protein [Mobiluncus mulieris]STO17178.1 Uncharacterised protein [Mobiluncus mulieris]
MGRKAVLATVLCLAVSLGVAACGSPKAPDSGSDEVSKQPVPHATLFEPETEWVKHAKTDKFKYWQIPRENADKAVHLERAMGGTGEFVVREGQLCFNAKHEQVPAVLLSDYQVSSEKIQISKNDFVRLGEKFKYDNGNYIGNISLIGLHGSKEKIPQEFTDSPCFTGEKYDRYVIIFENSLSN